MRYKSKQSIFLTEQRYFAHHLSYAITITKQTRRLSKRTTTPITWFLSCDSSVFLSRDLQSAPSLCFRWFRRRFVLEQNAQSHLRAWPPHCPNTREILGKGHIAGRRARSCRCETLLVPARLLGPCGFPAGLSAQSRDWVGPTRPQEQHGPGAQLTSGPQEGREGNESHQRRPVGFYCLTGWTVSISGAATISLVGLTASKPVVSCYYRGTSQWIQPYMPRDMIWRLVLTFEHSLCKHYQIADICNAYFYT